MASTDGAGTKISGQDQPKRINYLALGTVIAAFAVVILHSNSFWGFDPRDSVWVSANVIECLFYFAVPFFYMSAGITNIDYRDKYSTKEFLKKRFFKTVIPFVFWTFIGLLYNVANHFTEISEITPEFIFRGFVENKINITYWFFWPLFTIYLCMPLISLIPKDKRLPVFKYVIVICFVFNVLPPFISNVFNFNYTSPVAISVGAEYLLYVFIGYVLAHEAFKLYQRLIIYALGIAGFLIHMVCTYNLSVAAGSIVDTYKGYTKFPCFLYSAAVFLLIRQLSEHIKNAKFWKFINAASTFAFPIYLMHPYFMSMSTQLGVEMGSPVYRFGVPFIVILICVIITLNVRKVPFIRGILP